MNHLARVGARSGGGVKRQRRGYFCEGEVSPLTIYAIRYYTIRYYKTE